MDTKTVTVEKAARELIDLLLTSEEMDLVMESTAMSAGASAATNISIMVPKVSSLNVDEMDLKPGELTVARMQHCIITAVLNKML